jgi:hypothetical protein
MKETPIIKDIQIALSHDDVRLWRNNIGEAWQGAVSRAPSGPWSANAILIQNPRIVNFGLCAGSSDLVGFKSRVITPEMVGQRVAVFAGIEVKTTRGVFRKGQRPWLYMVDELGGISGVARSVDDAKVILGG